MFKTSSGARARRRCFTDGMQSSSLSLLFAGAVALLGATPGAALTQSWNGYHWARTGTLALSLGNNLNTAWTPYLAAAAPQWSAANNIDLYVQSGKTPGGVCNGVYGSVQVCNGDYGANGWLGYAMVWTSRGFIVQATVQLNDYYFGQAYYNTTAWRQQVTCQEVGHTLGLAHTNEVRTDPNTGSCMDYTNDPTGTLGTNGTLANTAPNSVDFAALDGIYATLDTTQLTYTTPQYVTSHSFRADGSDDDQEPVAVVPEPATWALLLVGFGATGAMMRRRAAVA